MEFDVCNSMENVLEVLLNLHLDHKHQRSKENPLHLTDRILLAVLHLSREQANLVASMLNDIAVAGIDIDKTSRTPPSLTHHPFFISFLCQYQHADGNFIARIASTFKWRHVYFINFHNIRRASIYQQHKKQTLQKLKRDKICFDSVSVVKRNKFWSIISRFDPRRQLAIVLQGNSKLQLDFIKKTKRRKFKKGVQWLTHDLGHNTPFLDISVTNWHNNKDLTYSNFLRNLLKLAGEASGITDTWVRMMFSYLVSIDRKCNQFLEQRKKNLYKKFARFLDSKTRTQFITLVNSSSNKVLLHNSNLDFKLSRLTKIGAGLILNTSCPAIFCEPGTEGIRKVVRSKEEFWDRSYKWRCRKCGLNEYKETSGTEKCRTCPSSTISNHNKTSCFNPYKNIHISINSTFMTFGLSICAICMGVNLIMMGVFIKHRKTPIAKSCDLKITWFHFAVTFMLNVLMPSVYLGMPTQVHCFARAFCISFFHVINLAIALIKSEKLVKAFNSSIKVNKKRVRKTEKFQLFTVLILMLLANLILFTSAYGDPINVFIITVNYNRMHLCNITSHTNLLLAYSAVLQLACLVQVFRGRKLPHSYNDNMSHLYGAFITSTVIVIFVPIFIFQDNEIGKQTLQMCVVVLNNFVLLVSSYAYKTYVLVFAPHINNPQFLRSECLEVLKQNAERKCSNKHETQC